MAVKIVVTPYCLFGSRPKDVMGHDDFIMGCSGAGQEVHWADIQVHLHLSVDPLQVILRGLLYP